jgi:glutamate---cysteine ligase / carboxylate-amine ligase
MMELASLEFTPSPRMTIGVEIELQVLDATTRDLSPGAPRLLERLGSDPRIRPELFQGMLEVSTGVCDDVGQVKRELEDTIGRLRAVGRDLGLVFAAAGSHPFARWRERLVYPSERFHFLIDRNRWLGRRLMIFGLHVHVGMRDGAHAVAMLNGLLPYLPHALALSASSPFWQGYDTGLASSRITLFEALPTAGHPCTFRSWEEFQALYASMSRSRAVTSIKDLWWDIRLHPDYGTVELRICDGLPTLSEAVAVVALVQVLFARLDAEYRNGWNFQPPPYWILRENKWRASRWGLEAEIVVDEQGHTRLLREEITGLLPVLEPLASSLGCSAELQRIGAMVQRGPSYERQRQVFERTQQLEAVAKVLAQELETDRPWESGAPN